MPSLRASAAYRIAINYAALLSWTILLLGGAIFYVADANRGRQHDADIARELDRLAASHERGELSRELRWRRDSPAANAFDYVLTGRDGKPAALPAKGSRARTAPSLDKVALARGENRIVSGRQGKLLFANGQVLVITPATPPGDRIPEMILGIFAASGVAVLLVSLIAGLILSRYLRRRLEPINATANAIAKGEITWRVPVRSPGDEFDTAGHAINVMLDRIAGLMENLRQVSSDIAHDLRKPLMRLLVQTDRLGRVEGAEQRIYELGDEMLMLFSSILRIAEVDGGGLGHTFQPIDLSEVMTDVAECFAPALSDGEHRIEWSIAPQVTVQGNRELLAQVASNLLDNALIHTPPGTTIRLGLAREGQIARLWVEDDGPGVSAEDRDKLLQRFFRAEASRTTPGNGLGLSLVAAAAKAHGGRVFVEDNDPGLRIVVALPAAD